LFLVKISGEGGGKGGAVFDGTHVVCMVRDDAGPQNFVEVWFPEQLRPPVVLEWRAKIENPGPGRSLYVGALEEAPSMYKNSIFVVNSSGSYKLITYRAGERTETALSNQDWSAERTFRISWSVTPAPQVELFIDDLHVATHASNVPGIPMIVFIEVANFKRAPSTVGRVYGRSWRIVAD
jgi:hypothetical protein